MATLKIGHIIKLQKCKHSWLNGLKATIVELHDNGDITCKSQEGLHVITTKNIK